MKKEWKSGNCNIYVSGEVEGTIYYDVYHTTLYKSISWVPKNQLPEVLQQLEDEQLIKQEILNLLR